MAYSNSKMNLQTAAGLLLLAQVSLLEAAEQPHTEESIEEIIVSAPFQATAAETVLPVGVLAGEALREKVSNSLGDTLKNEVGISSASFGSSVGHPVIRGQTGNRVSVLQNGVGVTDAANLSPDHAEGVEPLLAERLEVIRGPATLLYGSGAVGGVVNVIDGRIPERLPEETEFFLEHSHDTVNDGNRSVLRLDSALGNVGLHVSGFVRDNERVKIPGFAIDEAGLEALEELTEALHVEEHDESEEEHEEFDNTYGYIANSRAEANGGSLGLSWVGERGFVGFSVNGLNNDYGLPGGTHGHEEEHEEEGLEEEEVHEEEEHGEVEAVRIDLKQQRYDLRGGLRFDSGFLSRVDASLGFTDYRHEEIEFFETGEREVGTRFDNEGIEGRLTVTRRATGAWDGVWGLQFADTDFSAAGEEAFIPATTISDLGVFGVERISGERATLELGLRADRNRVDPAGVCETEETAISVSGSVIYEWDDQTNVIAGVSRSQRTPSVEELYSNIDAASCALPADPDSLVLHAATNLLEVGNPGLSEETANNIELGLRRHSGPWTGELSLYHNRIDDYIFLDLLADEIDGQRLARYESADATFTGAEAKLSLTLASFAQADLDFSVFGDRVRASFDAGGNVPRIPPAKFGAELRLHSNHWSTHIHVTRATEQDRTGLLELATPGYTELSLYGDYHWTFSEGSELKVYARANNLLDEEIRNHASFLKHFAPEPGRGVLLGVRFDY